MKGEEDLELIGSGVEEGVKRTNVECPREKKVPTVTGRWPEAMRRRVMRSMAW